MTVKRSGIVAGFGSVVAVLAWAGVAFACTAVAGVEVVGSRGTPGSQTVVEGRRFEPGPVQLRWNTADGPLLATATGPEFSVPVTVPDAPDGVAFVIAVQRDSKGTTWRVPGSLQVGRGAAPAVVSAGASLLDRNADSGGSSMVPGVVLLSAGTALLAAGFATAEARRRRATAALRATD